MDANNIILIFDDGDADFEDIKTYLAIFSQFAHTTNKCGCKIPGMNFTRLLDSIANEPDMAAAFVEWVHVEGKEAGATADDMEGIDIPTIRSLANALREIIVPFSRFLSGP